MGIEASDVHVLVQDLDSERVAWWREAAGPIPARTIMDLRMPPHRGAVWVARHWTTDRAEECGVPEDLLPDLALLTSELVGNVVVHGSGGEVEVRFSIAPGQATVEVSDASMKPPQIRDPEPGVPGGQGLRLVELIATQWGHRVLADSAGKMVWFNLTW